MLSMFPHSLTGAGRAFIELSAHSMPTSGQALAFVLGRYDSTAYLPSLFEHHAIAFPPELQRSVRARQAEYLAGRLCAAAALTPFGWRSYRVGSGAWREPIWPTGLQGSISHTASHAAALVAPSTDWGGVGIDIESLVAADTRDWLLGSAVTQQELDWLVHGAPRLPQGALLTLAFSAKESFFKAAFHRLGRYIGFEDAHACAISPAAGVLLLRCVADLAPGLERGQLVPVRFFWLDPHTLCTGVALRAVNVDSVAGDGKSLQCLA